MKKSLILILVCGIFVPQLSAQKLSLQDNNKVSSEVSKITEIVLPAPEMGGGMPLMEVLAKRATTRAFNPEELPLEELSNLLWAANGVNRKETGKRTAPSARNAQEIDIYVSMSNGLFFYNPVRNTLECVLKDDIRAKISDQKFFKDASIVLVFVGNYDKMEGFSKEAQEFYSATDVGYVSQNVYLYCAQADLATVVCGSFDKEFLNKVLKIKNGKVLLVQPVGRMR
jgi:SagB-type dehydrogenase family enzyme